MSESAISFEEAVTRAKAAHVPRSLFRQSGNNYRLEYECTCGLHIAADRFAGHVIDAADALREGFRLDGSGVLFVKRVPNA